MFIKLYSNFFHWQFCHIKMFLLHKHLWQWKSSWCFPLVFIAPSIELCQISADMHTFSLFCFIFITMSNFCSSSIFLCCVIIVMNMKLPIMLLWYQKKRGSVSWCNSTEKWIAMLIFQWLKMNNVSCFGCCIEPQCCCFCF